MGNFNRKCLYCGQKYYVCRSCIKENSYKNSCCSTSCFRAMLKYDMSKINKFIDIKESKTMPVVLRAKLLGGFTVDVTGYDLELGKFDCTDGVTRKFDDFEYFIFSKNELKEIGKKILTLNENKVKVNINENKNKKDEVVLKDESELDIFPEEEVIEDEPKTYKSYQNNQNKRKSKTNDK